MRADWTQASPIGISRGNRGMDFADSAPHDRRSHWSRCNRGGCNILSGWNFTDMDAPSSGAMTTLRQTKKRKKIRLLSHSFCQMYIVVTYSTQWSFPEHRENSGQVLFFLIDIYVAKGHSNSAAAKAISWTFIWWRILNAHLLAEKCKKRKMGTLA